MQSIEDNSTSAATGQTQAELCKLKMAEHGIPTDGVAGWELGQAYLEKLVDLDAASTNMKEDDFSATTVKAELGDRKIDA